MPRSARSKLLYDGCYAHIFSRSFENRHIFKVEADFHYFLKLVMAYKAEYPYQIFHYCLMNTHFHMAVGIKRLDDFSKALQLTKWAYTRQYNKKYGRWGPLWRERFKSMLIEDENYLFACGQYIELNPVKSGMVEHAQEWSYSSARYYTGIGNDSLIDEYEKDFLPDTIELEESAEFTRGTVIGSEWFKYKIMKGIV